MEIHTIEARSNFMFNVLKDHFKLSYESIGEDIRSQFHIMKEELNNKKINYSKLKNTLTPQKSKRDICLVFDTTFIDDTWYGHTIFKKYFPIITTYSGVCIFEGDFIASNEHQKRIHHEISKYLIKFNHSIFKNSCQYYLVYFTNLTKNRINKLIEGLKSEQIFTGYFDFTYSSLLKTYISNIIGQSYFIYKNNIVMSMPDDYNKQNINTVGYDFDKYGLNIISISNINYLTFLTYKIERPYNNSDISDQLFSLSAISNIALPLKDFRIIIDYNKYQYLKTEKNGSMNASKFRIIDKTDIEIILKQKIENNYIFNLRFLEEYNTILFNTIIEIENRGLPFKYLVSLKYKPNENILQLVTMYLY